MSHVLHGKVNGKIIELDEELDLPNGQKVEVQVTLVPSSPIQTPGDRLSEIYAILGERYDSGHTDTAEKHNEHQP